jgi:hypothetical protein
VASEELSNFAKRTVFEQLQWDQADVFKVYCELLRNDRIQR